jgi:DNA-binding response OmpR family regulator
MGSVLLVEDEPVLRASMARGLGKLPGVEVLEAGTVDEALALIETSSPDFIISDIDLPRRSGLELVGELKQRHLDIPLLFVSAYLKAYRPQIPPNANVEILEKPVALEELRARVLEQLKEPKRTRAPFAVTDYVQLACMGKHSVEILASWAPRGRGQVVVANGTVWSARDTEGSGLAAFRRFAFRADATVEVRGLEGTLGPRDIDQPWEVVLLESAQLADEAARPGPGAAPAGQASGPTPALVAPAPGAPTSAPTSAPTFDELWATGVEALLKKDYPRARVAFLAARTLRPDDGRVGANLKRLADLGFADEQDSNRRG